MIERKLKPNLYLCAFHSSQLERVEFDHTNYRAGFISLCIIIYFG